jgi:hypothetical protein
MSLHTMESGWMVVVSWVGVGLGGELLEGCVYGLEGAFKAQYGCI